MGRKRLQAVFTGYLCVLTCARFASGIPTYLFHEIPIDPGLSGAQTATGVNENGVVSGNLITSPDYGFVWDQTSGAEYFNPGGPAGGEWHGEDINDNNEVVSFFGGANAWKGAIWRDSSYDDLGGVSGYIETVPIAINNHGTVVGGTWASAYGAGPPCIGDAASGMRILDAQFPNESLATDINDANQIVGYNGMGSTRTAWRYESGTIQTLPHLSGSSSMAQGINAAGKVAGVSNSRAVLWQGSLPQDLGTLGGSSSQANAVNDNDVVVGRAHTASGAEHAFVWQDGQMHDLNYLANAPAGWTLVSASDVSNNGVIAGSGYRNGQQRAFALIPVLLGDADRDGDVDDDDLSRVLANWTGPGGRGGTWETGDFDRDGGVSEDDLSLLLANWTGSAAVPGPATLSLLGLGGLVLLRHKRRPRRI